MENFIKIENFSKILPYLEMFKEGLIITILLAFFTVVIGFVLAPHIITLFRRDDPLVIAIGTRAFRYQCFTLPLGAVMVFANMFFQALGKSWRAVVLAICRQGLYIPLVYLMTGWFGLPGLERTQAASDLLAFVVAAVVLLHYFKTEFGKET